VRGADAGTVDAAGWPLHRLRQRPRDRRTRRRTRDEGGVVAGRVAVRPPPVFPAPPCWRGAVKDRRQAEATPPPSSSRVAPPPPHAVASRRPHAASPSAQAAPKTAGRGATAGAPTRGPPAGSRARAGPQPDGPPRGWAAAGVWACVQPGEAVAGQAAAAAARPRPQLSAARMQRMDLPYVPAAPRSLVWSVRRGPLVPLWLPVLRPNPAAAAPGRRTAWRQGEA